MNETEAQSELIVSKPITRWYGIDILRGIGILGVIFIHAVIMNYALIDEIDLDNLPPYLMVLYIMDFWGGIYALISGTVNIYAIYQHSIAVNEQSNIDRSEAKFESYRWKYLFKYGFILLLLHFLYSYALGPTYHDFETGIHKYSLIPGILRQGWGYSVNPERMITSSALSMIALNLLVLGLLAFWLFRNNPKQKLKRNKRIFLILGFIFVSFAFFQIPLNIIYLNLVDANKYFPVLFL
ncbi:MAG: hypothetical protein E4G98_05275, partial [Promethearchaeota archaeon]